ncbi:hypothetical protein Ddye_026199 [Dipteronia dyeriana]|uniref:GrpE protein homolog n=1 Tax=Dipteronia dyeriana TaxID=168575 RepID=A0AAD9TMP8_9ROSI|nr:hypothetical protein Ddye_026199 [Dipteronia dyeriana]
MATVLKTAAFQAPPRTPAIWLKYPKPSCVSFRQHLRTSSAKLSSRTTSRRFASVPSLRFVKFRPFSSTGETEITQTQEEILEPQIEDSSDGAVDVEDGASDGDTTCAEEAPTSIILTLLQSYKEALANDDARVAEIEAFFISVEDEKIELESQLTKLSEELSIEKDRLIRISADFDNFRKRTEKERLSLVTNAQGEVVERLLQVLDNFERAKTQIKVETEGEEKVNNSYQSICKQLVEIFSSLGVVPVETIGNPFDPLLHEAIMREDSDIYEEGIIIEEYRKGFKLGDRLLRPSMVKVSAGPGPAKPEGGLSEGGADVEEEKSYLLEGIAYVEEKSFPYQRVYSYAVVPRGPSETFTSMLSNEDHVAFF